MINDILHTYDNDEDSKASINKHLLPVKEIQIESDFFGQTLPSETTNEIPHIGFFEKDPVITEYTNHVFNKYYTCYYYVRGIPVVIFPMLLTSSQRLFSKYYIKHCNDHTGKNFLLSECIACNNNSIIYDGPASFQAFRYYNFGVILVALILIALILREALVRAHLCVQLLDYKVFVKSAWYYFNKLIGIVMLSLLCFCLSYLSSIIMVNVKKSDQYLHCNSQLIYLTLSDSYDSWLLWTATLLLSCYFYWPVIDHLIDLYDTPHKIFIEPDDLIVENGQRNNNGELLKRLSNTIYKVRIYRLEAEIKQIHKEMGKSSWFIRYDRLEDDILKIAIYRLFKKNELTLFTNKPHKNKKAIKKLLKSSL